MPSSGDGGGWRGILLAIVGEGESERSHLMRERESMNCLECNKSLQLFKTAYGELCGNCINKIEREVNH